MNNRMLDTAVQEYICPHVWANTFCWRIGNDSVDNQNWQSFTLSSLSELGGLANSLMSAWNSQEVAYSYILAPI